MTVSTRAGQLPKLDELVNIPRLITAYYVNIPDPSQSEHRVAFGTSGHRGSSLHSTFNEWHVLAITQAICEYRAEQGITGPLFIGMDTHALSEPAQASALEVLAANKVETLVAPDGGYTPTPVISHAIICYNRGRRSGLADGIVISPSHNPPDSGGFKYNPTHGGPADTAATNTIQARANALLESKLQGVKRLTTAQAMAASTTRLHDYVTPYVDDLASVIDFDVIRASTIRMGVDPLGGAGVAYWPRIAEAHRLDLTVLNTHVDPTFRFMAQDWDGKVRMDPSSAWAMKPLIGIKDQFDVAFACDTDHDRHGIVTPSVGLLPPNHYLSVAIDYLYRHREAWSASVGVGKTLVSSQMIDRVASRLNRRLVEVPVGFKWFVDGLVDGSLGFGGEESAGATFLRRDGTVWSTDKDGIILGLLAGEMTARQSEDPGVSYRKLTDALGEPVSTRVEAVASPAQKKRLSGLSPQQITSSELAGEPITAILTEAPGNGAAIGGVKVTTQNGWFAARPSGTEDIYKIYAESFKGQSHVEQLVREAQAIVDAALVDANA